MNAADWISVDERLPDDGQEVLIWHNLGDRGHPEVPYAVDVASYIGGKWIFPWDRGLNQSPRWVIAWQPIVRPERA